MSDYYPADGEWVAPKLRFNIACCDCGLIHKVELRIRKGAVEFRARRDAEATRQRRRHLTAAVLGKGKL